MQDKITRQPLSARTGVRVSFRSWVAVAARQNQYRSAVLSLVLCSQRLPPLLVQGSAKQVSLQFCLRVRGLCSTSATKSMYRTRCGVCSQNQEAIVLASIYRLWLYIRIMHCICTLVHAQPALQSIGVFVSASRLYNEHYDCHCRAIGKSSTTPGIRGLMPGVNASHRAVPPFDESSTFDNRSRHHLVHNRL